MEVRILGPFEVGDCAGPVELNGSRQRALLARLAIAANRVVAVAALVDDLWGPQAGAGARQALQAQASRVRRALRDPSRLVTRPPGYVLHLEPEELDAAHFETLLKRARTAAAEGDPDCAVDQWAKADACWRGPALADLQDYAFAQSEAARLEELRLGGTEARVQEELALGRHGELIAELETLVAEHPFRERLWAHLILALYRSGRQAQALRTFQELRHLLIGELGIEPNPELHRLESDMLRQDPSLEWQPPLGRERAPATSHSRPPETRYARSAGTHIAYQATGLGDLDILVVPGWISHLEMQWDEPSYRRFMERLGSKARVIRFDKRNMGLSDRIGDSMPSLEDRMDDLRAVVDAAGSRRAVVFGISEGTALSILFTATYPDRVVALILLGGSARLATGPDYPWGMTDDGLQALRHALEEHWGRGVTLPLIHPTAAGEPQVRDWWGRFERMAASPGAAIATAEMCVRTDVRELLPVIRVPTLVLHRRNDLLVDVAHSRYLAEHVPDAEYVELSGSDHWPWIGDSDSVLKEIETFLASGPRIPDREGVLATVLMVHVATDGGTPVIFDQGWGSALPGAENELLTQRLREFRGRQAGTYTDRLLATFDGPARATRCAVRIRDDVAAVGLRARCGMHIGEVRFEGTDALGAAVEVAAAVVAEAKPGEVLVSNTVREVLAGAGVTLQDRGHIAPRDLSLELGVFAATAV